MASVAAGMGGQAAVVATDGLLVPCTSLWATGATSALVMAEAPVSRHARGSGLWDAARPTFVAGFASLVAAAPRAFLRSRRIGRRP